MKPGILNGSVLWYFDQLFDHSSHRAMNGTDLELVTGHLEGRIGWHFTLKRNVSVGIPGAVWACAMCLVHWFKYILYFYCFSEHFTSIPFYLVVYSIYTNACTVVNYLFASVTYRDNRILLSFLILILRTIYACWFDFNSLCKKILSSLRGVPITNYIPSQIFIYSLVLTVVPPLPTIQHIPTSKSLPPSSSCRWPNSFVACHMVTPILNTPPICSKPSRIIMAEQSVEIHSIPRQMPNALNGCLCGIVVDSQSEGFSNVKLFHEIGLVRPVRHLGQVEGHTRGKQGLLPGKEAIKSR